MPKNIFSTIALTSIIVAGYTSLSSNELNASVPQNLRQQSLQTDAETQRLRSDSKPEHTHPHSSQSQDTNTQHPHKQVEIPAGQPVPAVNLVVHPDAERGWNLEIQVKNFTFAPERVNTSNLSTEGHAHLYINGQKITRLYGSWYYLSALTPGKNTITVTLNTNGHADLMHNGQPIQATQTIQVPVAEKPQSHH